MCLPAASRWSISCRCAATAPRCAGRVTTLKGQAHATLRTAPVASARSLWRASLQAFEKDRTTEVGSPVQVAVTADGTTGSMFVANLTVAPAAQRAFAVLAASGTQESKLSAVSTVVVAGRLGQPPARGWQGANCMPRCAHLDPSRNLHAGLPAAPTGLSVQEANATSAIPTIRLTFGACETAISYMAVLRANGTGQPVELPLTVTGDAAVSAVIGPSATLPPGDYTVQASGHWGEVGAEGRGLLIAHIAWPHTLTHAAMFRRPGRGCQRKRTRPCLSALSPRDAGPGCNSSQLTTVCRPGVTRQWPAGCLIRAAAEHGRQRDHAVGAGVVLACWCYPAQAASLAHMLFFGLLSSKDFDMFVLARRYDITIFQASTQGAATQVLITVERSLGQLTFTGGRYNATLNGLTAGWYQVAVAAVNSAGRGPPTVRTPTAPVEVAGGLE